MLIKAMNMIFIPSLILSTILTCSSYSWFTAWIGLEINLMSFTPILISNLTPKTTETAIKYFLIQALASMVIMTMIMINSSFNVMSMNAYSTEIISVSLGLKAGIAPVHFWFPQIISELQWSQTLILLTWQKIAPLILLSYNLNLTIYILIVMSAIIGALGGLNQIILKKLLAFSSIINAAWLLTLSFTNMKMWWTYFILYSSIVVSVIFSCVLFSVNKMSHLSLNKIKSTHKLIIFLNIMSMAGMPPFAGFLIKMMSIYQIFFITHNVMIITILVVSSILSFYFYLRLMYSSLMVTQTNYIFQLINKKNVNNYYLSTFLTVSMTTNLIIPLISMTS